MTMKKKPATGGNRMKQLGKVPITIWVTPDQKKQIEECAERIGEKTAGFTRQAALNRATDVRRQRFYG